MRGRQYYLENRITALNISPNGDLVTALVAGSNKNHYQVNILLHAQLGGHVFVNGECSCPVGYNCKHVVATLIKAQAESPLEVPAPSEKPSPNVMGLPDEISIWLNDMSRAVIPTLGRDYLPLNVSQRLLYVLTLGESKPEKVDVTFFTVRLLKAGGFGKKTLHSSIANLVTGAAPHYFTERDQEIVTALNLIRATGGYLAGAQGARWMSEMITTGRCFWETSDSIPLSLGEKCVTQPVWTIDTQGNQRLQVETTPPSQVLPFSPPWYINEIELVCGELDIGLPDEIAYALLTAPAIPSALADQVGKELIKNLPGVKVQLPQVLREKKVSDRHPVPYLRFYTVGLNPPPFLGSFHFKDDFDDEPKTLDLVRLEFDYGGVRIDAMSAEKSIAQRSGDELLRIDRDTIAEENYSGELASLGFFFVDLSIFSELHKKHNGSLILGGDDKEWINFCLVNLPDLRASGWQIEMEPSFNFRFAEIEGWTATVNEDGGNNDWFSIELGIQVDGLPVNLLPVLLDLIRQFPEQMSTQALAQLSAEDVPLVARLADGRLVTLPISRIQNILSVMVELFDKDTVHNVQRIELSAVQAGRLAELDDVAGLRWLGGERLRELGRKLRDFHGIQLIAPPAGLKTNLRGYQQEGLNWLQFLREYELAGILADDMGLGKTVQALAHLLVEKESGRMNCPSLVVAPTSLMFNWLRETERFAPDLRVLVLQGQLRKQHFEAIGAYDLVLTTYPLLPRDKEVLIGQEFHLLILDEAHIIKNPKSQATQIVHQIKARHRLALTGTPLENHLGELWSLFHFLLPGLLGNDKNFRKLFRTPIEKQGDNTRRAVLSRRIAPFLLRRTKAQVAKELPLKTEIIRSCELSGAQRDLYETIRVAMHEKIRLEIDKKGMNRSHIIILDALLKLRQICCDPRLLKLPAAKQVTHSAKLELLMSLLPDMVEEGRSILLFSQFTSMLALIELELVKFNLPFVKLTGDTRDRATPVKRFQSGEVPIFLISLKAGGVGLNLTAADTVIHYDPWWNPAVENQATDRAHRIGQENPVFVYKLITESTVEEKIIAMQGKKRDLAQSILNDNGEAIAPLSTEELAMLFEPLQTI
ncbi:Superfamily II DNA or RNA helicase, SNF2 family [Candidatus Nitrotoga sp. BS]|uniref:DEAD/DEAH box helicase n=1 Tax=Candidatus Nitrotoga sp. BS TaxID=2890408 RepID=UPI001EF2E227|nr:DEAD/DEAH box helicase [Candidatus Nitrotoga sp. BS]CAH1189737.1 Superfamily II DNA or RNA helicase, SNF2 family [Candidatus Nitrotoga sp. BS]